MERIRSRACLPPPQVVFSKSLTNKWPNLPTIGRYIMNVIEPDKIPEPSFDEEGNETLGSGKMPTAPFIYNHPPHDFRNPVIQERKWGYGNMNNTTHAGHHEVTHIYPKGPEEPQSTYKDKIWRDYNTMQRTAKPRQPAPSTPPQVNEFVQYNTVYGDGDAFDQAADEVFLDPVVEGQPGADVPEESHEALVEGFLPPIPDAEPRPMGGEEEKVVEGREAEALPEAEAPVVLPEDEDRAEEEKGASEEVPAEGGEEAMGVGEEILAEGGVGPHAAEEAEGGAEAAVEDEPPVEAVEEKTREEAEAMAEKKPAEEATVADDEEEEPADTASHGA